MWKISVLINTLRFTGILMLNFNLYDKTSVSFLKSYLPCGWKTSIIGPAMWASSNKFSPVQWPFPMRILNPIYDLFHCVFFNLALNDVSQYAGLLLKLAVECQIGRSFKQRCTPSINLSPSRWYLICGFKEIKGL